MSEEEKMLQGKLYNGQAEELLEKRQKAKSITFQINHLDPLKLKEREKLVKKLIPNCGKDCYIEPPFQCDYGTNIVLGEYFYANYNCVILDCAKVTIGDCVMLGPNVSMITAGHPIDPEVRDQNLEYAFPITIGNHVWIGANVVILPNITIGDNCVIGAGSVITKNVPENSVVVGNPGRIIRQISPKDKQYYFKQNRIDGEEEQTRQKHT